MRLKPIITLQAGAAALLLAACAQTQPVREVPVAAETVPVVTGPAPEEAGAEEQVWSDENFDKLLAALRGLSSHGLNPEDYDLDTLEAVRAAGGHDGYPQDDSLSTCCARKIRVATVRLTRSFVSHVPYLTPLSTVQSPHALETGRVP